MNIETPNNSYADILQRLVRRYLFKLERQKEEGQLMLGANLLFTRKRTRPFQFSFKPDQVDVFPHGKKRTQINEVWNNSS